MTHPANSSIRRRQKQLGGGYHSCIMATYRAAVMGGAFDPIHFAHLFIAEEARASFDLDEVIFIPNNRPPLPKHELAPAKVRLAMVEKAIRSNPQFSVSSIEVDREGPSYSFDTIREIRQSRPNIKDLFFITGADAILALSHWYRHEEILKMCEFIAAARPGFDLRTIENALPPSAVGRVHYLPIPNLEISSTDIRSRIRDGRSIRYLTPDSVADHIQSANLYKLQSEGDQHQ
jgi:nicotinate-nucleotide adenylyltransferase